MFNQYISGPVSLLQEIKKLENSTEFNDQILLFGFKEEEGVIKYAVVVEDTNEAESIANSFDVPVILVIGVDRQPYSAYGTHEALSHADKFTTNSKNQVLDILSADFVNDVYISDMCDNSACCDPENPTSFAEKKTPIIGIPELVDMLNQ